MISVRCSQQAIIDGKMELCSPRSCCLHVTGAEQLNAKRTSRVRTFVRKAGNGLTAEEQKEVSCSEDGGGRSLYQTTRRHVPREAQKPDVDTSGGRNGPKLNLMIFGDGSTICSAQEEVRRLGLQMVAGKPHEAVPTPSFQ
jgi:hypothetical protein